MADFLSRLRAKLEAMQQELAPEAGFDRRAYGYDDDADPEDATFEDLDREEESPWRRPADGPPRPRPDEAVGGPAPAGAPEAREPETPRPRARPGRGSAAAGPEGFDPFGVAAGPSGGGVRRRAPPPSPWEASTASARRPGAPAPGVGGVVRSLPRDFERVAARGTSRSSRLRARLRQPESLRELFLLREVIDRPVALRRRPPPRTLR